MDKLPSMKDIAEKLGVSKMTVSLALRNDPQISESRKKEVLDTAKAMGYVRNSKLGEFMSQMRGGRNLSSNGNIALVNCNQDPKALYRHPTIPIYVEGIKRRAKNLGYSTDSFWLFEPGLTSKSWIRILNSRGIVGIILTGMMKQNRIPEFFIPVVSKFPTVVTGVRTKKPALSFSSVDHHVLTLRAFEKAVSLGAKKPGLVLDQEIDVLVEHRFTAAFRSAQHLYLKKRFHIPPFMQVVEARKNIHLFNEWFQKYKPDTILTLYDSVANWVTSMGYTVPVDVGLIQLEKRSNSRDWAGMDQHNDICGEASVDMLVNSIYNGDVGLPEYPRATLIGASWKDGKTILSR
jgi:LacI family transcriptional regulator